MTSVIKIENLWKEYRLGVIGHGTLTHDLQSWWAKVRGKEDPNAKIAPMLAGQEKQIDGDHFWALQDINLEVKQGEILGIIGSNGAGKSTLLKILSRVTAPTKGGIKVKGRIASLLEVGTGFHPELTGRENIFMNGAILGMSKQEITAKLDEIIDFSGVESFVDTPVKRYSSGMYVRLAFAVAAHLEPEILVVDEVLAVGDADFQKKCLNKMGEVATQGRTVLFVSHNMLAIRELCPKVCLLANGSVSTIGPVVSVIEKYFSGVEDRDKRWVNKDEKDDHNRIVLRSVEIISQDNKSNKVDIDQKIRIDTIFDININGIDRLCVNVYVKDSMGGVVFSTANTEAANINKSGWFYEAHSVGTFLASCEIPPNFFNNISYTVSVYIVSLVPFTIEAQVENAVVFDVHDTGIMREKGMGGEWHGLVRPMLAWNTERIN